MLSAQSIPTAPANETSRTAHQPGEVPSPMKEYVSTKARSLEPRARLPDQPARLRGEDVCGIRGPDRPPLGVEGRKTDPTLDDQGVAAPRDDLAETHSPNRVERQSRFHSQLDINSVDPRCLMKGTVRGDHLGVLTAYRPGHRDVVALRQGSDAATGE